MTDPGPTKLDLLAIYIYEPERFQSALEQSANDWDRYMADQIALDKES